MQAPRTSQIPNTASRLRVSADHSCWTAVQDTFPIPTDDPAAALRFCQRLAEFLSTSQEVDAPQPASEWLEGAVAETRELRFLRPALSVVIPVFNEEENLPVLYERLCAVLDTIEPDYEIVFVDDGSHDGSLEVLNSLTAQNERVVVVEMARNFGHQVAISAGLDIARGDGVAIMDADLQDPPEVLPAFVAKWREGYDVVYAVREKRKEGWAKRMAYMSFYRLLRLAANVDIPLDAGDFCVMDRRVVDVLRSMPERNRFVRGIRSWAGGRQMGLPYERQARYSGRPKYTFVRLFHLAAVGLVSFSYVPLRIITLMGTGISVLSILLALVYAIKKLVAGLSPPGFATLVVSIFFLAGIQLVTIGVIGEYVGRIFEEVKQRPLYVLRRVTRGAPGCES